jgi:hypothetical protein
MNTEQLQYLKENTKELIKDKPLVNWLIKLDNHYLKDISNNTELTSVKDMELFNFINYIITNRFYNN